MTALTINIVVVVINIIIIIIIIITIIDDFIIYDCISICLFRAPRRRQ